jgi:Ca2+-transporting ATPase
MVVATGMETEVGEIATEIAAAPDEETPFEREVDRLGRRIGIGVIALIAVLAGIQATVTGTEPLTIVLVAVTLAVAAVPEGLPAVVTLTLALGSRTLLAQKALVRSLPVVQSLGSVDTIVTDKTGTLTENAMTVRRLYYGEETYQVSGSGTETEGAFTHGDSSDDGNGDAVAPETLAPLLRCGAVCNDAGEGEDGYYGDPTEIALLVSAAKAGIDPDVERVGEVPFSSERKRMTVVLDEEAPGGEKGPTAYTKGAPGEIVERCDRAFEDGEVVDLTDERRGAIEDRIEAFAGDALRVLAFAYRPGVDPDGDAEDIETGMVLLGLQGMIDPPREEVPGAVADCRDAGIRVVMATGDNVETARAIGREIGFDPEGALTGRDLDGMDEADLQDRVEDVDVFARVSPKHKVSLLRALQANDHTVAMTGDGVNDAPALRNADVGVSMGERGTDVARGASDMVLLDDNFATIRSAIAEGRGIFDNVRKFVNYLLSANAGEVLVVFLGVLLGAALFPETFAAGGEAVVLTPVMLLWLNLVTDGLPALALGADPKAEDVMERDPRESDESVIDARLAASILGIGVVMTVTGLAAFFVGLEETGSLVRAQSLLFTFLVTVEMVRIQVIRSRYRQSILSNPWLIGAIVSSLLLQLAVLYTPLNDLFEVVPLDLVEWSWIAVAFVAFVALNLGVVKLLDRVFGSGIDAESAIGAGRAGDGGDRGAR